MWDWIADKWGHAASWAEEEMEGALEWAYAKALEPGVPGVHSASLLAADYVTAGATYDEQVNRLIRWQNAKAGTAGFVSGLGGLMTLPLSVPANVSAVLFVQIRMIAAIAVLGGQDPKKDQVKTLIFLSLCGNAASEVVKQFGLTLSEKLLEQLIRQISLSAIREINKAVGFRLLTKFGETGLINLGKLVPLVGGVLVGSLDAVSTNTVGNLARDLFRPTGLPNAMAAE